MKVYLVGGAVRDRLLGLPVKERDYVVVGATPEAMLAQGYKPVGKDFPVFLHPQTGEEYALARTERKSGHGYSGFTFHTGEDVTLEDDLSRRDLTINAIAQDEQGTLIDPYGGQRDLAARQLRHVSPAFTEDPLRVLRVARFAARFAPQGFTVAPETRTLLRQLVASGELDHLVPERVWQETGKALRCEQPSRYFLELQDCGALALLMPELAALSGVPQRADYHPEVDSLVHTLMCVDAAAREGFSLPVRYSALVHDLGKAATPPREWPSHHMHDQRGLPLVETFSRRLRVPNDCRELALLHTREHLLVHRVRELRPATLLDLLERSQALRAGERFELMLQACLCDARGRLGFEHCEYPQNDYLRAARAEAIQLQAADVMGEGLSGPAIGQALRQRRIAALKQWRAGLGGNPSV
ncbi:tRNA nucleotidyltransferase (CCA-adding enzyme) [Solimonas aquatica]|uniref:Multifunctional CCA protein n=1 Tax=Solimonas aquatica TaxID=489703 RepID=A0A1H9EVR1_9GAMM|nr:multifunctional CCA addition/repair protein [Solimonas aquatica]SEQ29800.1 tRNA nucleotidyltransferase (CCA-adding enzyme) [Solimonas aquatica]